MQQLQGRAAAHPVPPSTAATAGAGETTASGETAPTAGKISLRDIHSGFFFFLLRRYAHTRTHAESPRCRGLPASLEPQAPFYRKKPQLLVGGACCLLVQYQGSCWIKPTIIHEATVNAVIVPKWEIGLALFLLPSFNSECRLLKAIWAGPGNIALL